MRAVADCPAHHLDQIGHVEGEAQYVDIIDRQEVKALHNTLRANDYLERLASVIARAVEVIQHLLVFIALFPRYPKEPERLDLVMFLFRLYRLFVPRCGLSALEANGVLLYWLSVF